MLHFSQPSLPVQIVTSFVPYLQTRHCFYALEPTPEVEEVATTTVTVAQHLPIPQIQIRADPKMHMRGQQEKQEETQRRGGQWIFPPTTISPCLPP